MTRHRRRVSAWLFLLVSGLGTIVLLCAALPGRPSAQKGAARTDYTNVSRLSGADIKSNVATVFVFLSAECPLAQKYSGTIESMYRCYMEQRVAFYGVFSGHLAEDPSARTFAADYGLTFPILQDRQFRLAEALGARITPEVVVLDAGHCVAYRGKIDNWFYGLGQRRNKATEHYLRDAITSLLVGKRPKIARTEPLGCFIRDLP